MHKAAHEHKNETTQILFLPATYLKNKQKKRKEPDEHTSKFRPIKQTKSAIQPKLESKYAPSFPASSR
jgi:hypothetical protein